MGLSPQFWGFPRFWGLLWYWGRGRGGVSQQVFRGVPAGLLGCPMILEFSRWIFVCPGKELQFGGGPCEGFGVSCGSFGVSARSLGVPAVFGVPTCVGDAEGAG